MNKMVCFVLYIIEDICIFFDVNVSEFCGKKRLCEVFVGMIDRDYNFW